MAESIPIVEPLIRLLVEYLVPTIKKQVSYLCCYSCNVQGLADEIPKLNIRKESVQQDADAEEDNLGVIRPEVVSCLKEVEEVQTKSSTICNDAAEVQKSCLSKWCPPLHYRLSRDALKTTKASIKLRETRLERIANPVNPADLPPIPATSVIGFESRDSIENEIMDALKDKIVYLIGICGMGGIGKTEIAEKIENRAREKTEDSGSMFEKVIMIVVSQQLDLQKLQKEIAQELRLEISEEESLMIRARKLHARLKKERSVLIILDDVWERLNLEELGIPSQSSHAGCKLILTSRDRNALTLTEDAKIFSLGLLNDEDSWILFRKSAGNSIDSSDLHETAKDVVKECNGLPLALVTVGSALRTAESKSSWEDALRELRQPIPTNIPGVLKEAYSKLLWSYNQLKNEDDKDVFLLCCLLPEDSLISLEALVRFGYGLGIFTGLGNLRQTRNRVGRIMENLIHRSLLMQSSDRKGDSGVKMHDVIRDMGICIASKGKHVFMVNHGMNEWPEPKEDSYGDYTCISLIFSEGNISVPECIKCSRLELLYVDFRMASKILPENFFGGITGLKVLEVSRIKLLPSSIHLLNNLRTLHLSNCELGMISIIGELINLQMLSLLDSDFEVLPEEIGNLRKLRKLDITDCQDLRRIAFGVLSRLAQLEELVLTKSFSSWDAEEKDKKKMENASLAELDSLSQLNTLHVEISDPNAIPKKMPKWVQKLTKYSITVAEDLESQWHDSKNQKAIVFRYNNATPIRDWFCDMAGNADYLYLEGPICTNVVNSLVRSGYQSLKHLTLRECTDIQYLRRKQHGAIFPILKTLQIRDSCSLQEISNGPLPAGSFKALEEIRFEQLSGLVRMWTFSSEKLCLSSLKVVKITDCGSLLYVFPLSIAESLSELERLEVSDCPVMKEIFKKEEGEVEITIYEIKLPKLCYLSLQNLPSLCGFCNGIDRIEVPALRELFIADLPGTTREGNHDVRQELLFDQQVFCTKLKTLKLEKLNIAGIFCHNIPVDNFCGLEDLTIRSCHKMSNLFSPVIFRGLTNLRLLDLEDCEELQEVIAKEDDQEGTTNIKETLSPQLCYLSLSRLPKMQRFCHINNDLEFPSLEVVRIDDCPMLEIFSPGRLHLPRFKYLYGLEDHDFAVKFFFKKEKSSDEIHSENNCFTLSPRDLSITMDKEGRLDWPLARDSSDSFVTAAEVRAFSGSLEIRGKIEIVKLLPGIAYEILFMVMVDEDESRWEKAVDVQLTLPGGIEQHRTEILDEKRRDECIEMLVAEFTREPHQIGQLEFSLSAKGHRSERWFELGIKGVRIRVKG